MRLRSITARRTVGVLLALTFGTSALVACGSDNEASPGVELPPASSKPLAEPSDSAGVNALSISASDLLKGNIAPEFPAGDAGKVSVVAQGPLSERGDLFPIAIRNNSGNAISFVEIAAAGRDDAGELKASGRSQGIYPAVVEPGALSLAFIYFEQEPEKGLKYEFTTSGDEPSTDSFGHTSLKVTEANLVSDAIVGSLQNTTGQEVQGPFSVQVFCFSGGGQLTSTTGAFASPDGNAQPDDKRSFSISLYEQPCRNFLVGSTGFFA